MAMWQEFVGLVGVVLALSTSSTLEDARDWLVGFEVRANPLRVLGDVLGSTLFTGVAVGFAWRFGEGPKSALLFGGLLGVSAHGVDDLMAMAHGVVRRLMGKGGVQAPAVLPQVRPRLSLVGGEQRRSEQLTEEEAFRSLEDGDEE